MLTASLMIGTSVSAQTYKDIDPLESSISAIDTAFRASPDGSGHSVLLALRKLRDPAMAPIFKRLLDSKEPAIRIDAVLALGELDAEGVDPFLLKKFSPEERLVALLAAIDLELISQKNLRIILAFEDLTEVERINLYIGGGDALLSAKDARQLFLELRSSENTTTRVMAAVFLAELGDGAALETVITEIPDLPISTREYIAAALADIGSRHPLPAATPLFQMIHKDSSLSRGSRLATIDAALNSNSRKGLRLWQQAARDSTNSGDRMRLGVMGLKHGIRLEDWTAFRDERLFNKLIAQTGEAVASGQDVQSAAVALVKARNAFLLEGALSIVENCKDPAIQRAIRREIVELAVEDERLRAVASRVITDLAVEDSDYLPQMMERLREEEDMNLGEVAMLGLLNADDPSVVQFAASYLDHPSRTARAMALVLRARYTDSLDEAELKRLGEIASGAGRVDASTRAMAAWLWLQHSGQREGAMTRIVGEA